MRSAPPQRFRLDNGLQVLLHEDRSAPLVAVHVAYRVGAADELDGQHGLAHLYEHLMYGGSANLPGAYLTHLTDAGAHDLNGRTGLDSTHYFETVHRNALEFALFAESDRMAHLVDTLSDDTLERQRKVVLNELRQYRERDDGRVREQLMQRSYAPGHPYRHGIIGSERDLHQISLDDAKAFGRRHYQPGNAVLALAGDLDLSEARMLCARYFGHIAGEEPKPRAIETATMCAPTGLQIMQGTSPLSKLHRVWNLPAPQSWLEEQTGMLLAWLLESRLRQQHAASRAEVRYIGGRLGAQMQLSCNLSVPIAGIDQEWRQLVQRGFGDPDLKLAIKHWVQQLAKQRGSRQGTAAMLIASQLLSPDAPHNADQLDTALLNSLLQLYLHMDRCIELQVTPAAVAATRPPLRRTAPAIVTPTTIAASAPPIERHELDNGLQILVARRPASAVIAARFIFNGGTQLESAMPMGTAQLSVSLALADVLASAAVEVQAEAKPDCVRIAWTATPETTQQLLESICTALIEPRYDLDTFTKLRDRQLASIAHEIARAESAVQRLLPALLFGPQARIATGLRSTVGQISIDQVRALHALQFQASNARLLLVGDPDIERIKAALRPMRSSAAMPSVQPTTSSTPRPCPLALIDAPNTAQALVTVAWPLPGCNAEQEAALQTLDRLLASRFSSRLNLRLREDLGWTYGVRSRISDVRWMRHYEIQTWVPQERAMDTRAEILRAIEALQTHDVDANAIESLRRSEALRLSGTSERVEGLAQLLESRLRLGLSDQTPESMPALDVNDLLATASQLLPMDRGVTLIVGDSTSLQLQASNLLMQCRKLLADAEALYR